MSIKVKKINNSHFIEGYIKIPVIAYLTNVNEGDEIPEGEAKKYFEKRRDEIADSSDVLEDIANSDVEF